MIEACDPAITMRQFGVAKTAQLLEDAAGAIQLAAQSPDEEAVHKMRVAIRRFQQSLRLFDKFLRPRGVKRVRRELKRVMEPAGQLRNHDIAIGLMKKAKSHSKELSEGRQQARTVFAEALRLLVEGNLAARWRKELKIAGV